MASEEIDPVYFAGFERGVKEAHDSLLPLIRALTACMVELEAKLQPGETSFALEAAIRELNSKGSGNESNESFN